MLSALVAFAAALSACWYGLDYLYIPKHHPDEPPQLSSNIPYIGHIIGLLRHGALYFEITR